MVPLSGRKVSELGGYSCLYNILVCFPYSVMISSGTAGLQKRSRRKLAAAALQPSAEEAGATPAVKTGGSAARRWRS